MLNPPGLSGEPWLSDSLVEQALDRTKKGTASKRAVPFFIDDDRLFGLTCRRISVGMCAYLGRGTMTIKPL